MKNRIESVITESMEPVARREYTSWGNRGRRRDQRLERIVEDFVELPQEEKNVALAAVGCVILGFIGAVLIVTNYENQKEQRHLHND
jgi:hypothetical protein